MEKTVSLILAGGMILGNLALAAPSSALSVQEEQISARCTPTLLDDIGGINRSQTIVIGGVENPLFCTFIDQDAALDNLKSAVPEILDEIKVGFSLADLDNSNWEEYYAGVSNLSSDSEYAPEDNLQHQILLQFFDIYENNDKNAEVINLASQYSNISKKLSAKQTIELGMMLPNYAPTSHRGTSNLQHRHSPTRAYSFS